MIGTVGTESESLEQVLSRLESWMVSDIAPCPPPKDRRNMGSHSIIFYSPAWNVGNSNLVHTSISLFFSGDSGKNELEGSQGGRSLRNVCSHGRLLGESGGQEW